MLHPARRRVRMERVTPPNACDVDVVFRTTSSRCEVSLQEASWLVVLHRVVDHYFRYAWKADDLQQDTLAHSAPLTW